MTQCCVHLQFTKQHILHHWRADVRVCSFSKQLLHLCLIATSDSKEKTLENERMYLAHVSVH